MVLRVVFASFFGVGLLLSCSASMAADYHPEEFLRLDLSKAVLSPTPLGPPAEFAPVAVAAEGEAAVDRCDDGEEVVIAEPKVTPPHRQATVRTRGETSKRLAHRRPAHRRGNPLDAQALDTRVQVWPCRSGGICDWKQ